MMMKGRQRRHNGISNTTTTTTTTNNNNNTTPPSSLPHISATLDLHGYRRDEAKPRIASFLEQHDGWVLIVTGTGQHSHDGPVLRDYVASLLQRRQMQHFLHPQNRGSFVVLASSGVEFRPLAAPVDSKVRIVAAGTGAMTDSHVRLVGRQTPRSRQHLQNNPSLLAASAFGNESYSGIETTTTTLAAAHLFDNPTLQEMVRDDSRVEEAKSLSLEEKRRREKEARLCKKKLEAALADSALEFERNQACHEQEEELYRKAMDVSRRQREEEEEEEARLLREALSLSKGLLLERYGNDSTGAKDNNGNSSRNNSTDGDDNDDDDELQRAIQVSLLLAESTNHSTPPTDENNSDYPKEEDDEEAIIRRAMELSLQDT